ncbi:universal stress protein [Amycolatopsis cynarae]|uniref:Universal stress protein n=1 Tax=Amycolatopsis cynarae TaxID=2995223 RepID=A0ABY7BEC9_9PSEU|nr:universal stress protein [Amycolatopsis sp. HUAS 11-8]WAL68978.1 universal stress protein [Amycolatopsis sp. HUAS 11-8]
MGHDETVLVGVDGSPSSLDAVRWAAAEAARRGAALTLLYACAVPSPEPYTPVKLPRSYGDALLDQGRERLEEAKKAAEHTAAVPVRTDLRTGQPVAELVRASETADLAVLGSRGLGGITGLLLGSVAVGLATHGHCPVVVVRGAVPEDGPIVAGVDGSPLSDAVLGFAFATAAARGVRLIAVQALASADDEEDLTPRLQPWKAKYPRVEVSQRLVEDRPVRALLHAAEGAQLIVVGSRGRGGFAGTGLGSTSHGVLHHAECPVAVLRPETVPGRT